MKTPITTLAIAGAALALAVPAHGQDDPVDPGPDPCGYDCSGPQDPAYTPPPATTEDTTPVIPRQADPYEQELAKRPAVKLTVEPKAWYDTSGKVPELRLYFANEGRYPVTGTVQLRYGRKSLGGGLGKNAIEVANDDHGGDFFKVPKGLSKKLLRGRKVKLTFVARLTAKDGTKSTVKKQVTAIGRGPTSAYDGVYTGTGGLKFTVSKGFVTDVVSDVRTFCPSSNTFRVQPLSEPDGFPAVVGRNGSFRADGDFIKDHVKIQGNLSRHGASKGTLSLFHTELTFGDGLGIDQCAGQRDWTAKHAK